MDGSLGEGEHGYISIAIMVPGVLLEEFIKLVDQVVFVLSIIRFLLVVIASIGWIQPTNVVLLIDLVAVKNHNHALLDWLLVLVEKKQKVNLVVGHWVANCGHVLVFCFELLPLVFYFSDDSNDVDVVFWSFLNDSVNSSDFFRVNWKVNVFLLYELRISVEDYVEVSLVVLFDFSTCQQVILSYFYDLFCFFDIGLKVDTLDLIPTLISDNKVHCVESVLASCQGSIVDSAKYYPARVSFKEIPDERILDHFLNVKRDDRVHRRNRIFHESGLEIIQAGRL